MALLSRPPDDLLIDAIKLAIVTYRNEQIAIDPNVNFRVERDYLYPPAQSIMPFVNVWSPSSAPANQSSSRPVELETISINVDCYTKGLSPDTDSMQCDAVAMPRLFYLKNQVKQALYRLMAVDFGFAVGTIARKKWPSWQLFQNDLKLPETEVVAGRWSFDVDIEWKADDIDDVLLDQIAVNTNQFGTVYQYGGD